VGGKYTLQETNISPKKRHFEDDFPFPKVGYVNPLEGIPYMDGMGNIFKKSVRNPHVDGHHLVTQVTDLTLQPSPLDPDEEVGPKKWDFQV